MMRFVVPALVAAMLLWTSPGCGLTDATQARLGASGLTELVLWRDPLSGTTSRDLSDRNSSRMAVTADGRVVLSTGDICSSCRVNVSTAAFFVGDRQAGTIRWGDTVGEDLLDNTADDGRLPFLVDPQGFLIVVELMPVDGTVSTTFTSSDLPIESPDDPSDDTAVRDSTVTNPAASGGACGAGSTMMMGMLVPLWLTVARDRRVRRFVVRI